MHCIKNQHIINDIVHKLIRARILRIESQFNTVESLLRVRPLYTRNVAFKEGWPVVQGKKSIHSCLDLHSKMAFLERLASRESGFSQGIPLNIQVTMTILADLRCNIFTK